MFGFIIMLYYQPNKIMSILMKFTEMKLDAIWK